MTTSKRPVGTTNVHDYEVESKRLSRLLRDVGITAINKKYENLMQSVIEQFHNVCIKKCHNE